MKKYTLLTLSLLTLHAPLVAFAKGVYTPLVGIPGVSPTSDFNTYINALYLLSISVAALLAVIKIVIAGVKWMMTDVVTSKGEAKKDIQGALIGLLIVLAAVLILNVINPKLTNVNLQIDQVPAVQGSGNNGTTGTSYQPQPGDHTIALPQATPTERKTMCEQIDKNTCTPGDTQSKTYSGASCYKGTYYPEKGGRCVVADINYVHGGRASRSGSEFDCIDIEPRSEINASWCVKDQSCKPSIWDCSAAIKRCTDANLVATDASFTQDTIDSSTSKIECEWP